MELAIFLIWLFLTESLAFIICLGIEAAEKIISPEITAITVRISTKVKALILFGDTV